MLYFLGVWSDRQNSEPDSTKIQPLYHSLSQEAFLVVYKPELFNEQNSFSIHMLKSFAYTNTTKNLQIHTFLKTLTVLTKTYQVKWKISQAHLLNAKANYIVINMHPHFFLHQLQIFRRFIDAVL